MKDLPSVLLYTVFAEFRFHGSAPLGTHTSFEKAFRSIEKLKEKGFQMRLVRIFEFPRDYIPDPEDLLPCSHRIVFQEELGKRLVAERFHAICPRAAFVEDTPAA